MNKSLEELMAEYRKTQQSIINNMVRFFIILAFSVLAYFVWPISLFKFTTLALILLILICLLGIYCNNYNMNHAIDEHYKNDE